MWQPVWPGGPSAPCVRVRVVVRNWLSPNYCQAEIKQSLEHGIPIDTRYHLKREPSEPCTEEELAYEAYLVADYVDGVTLADGITVFIQQEAWPKLVSELGRRGFAVPDKFHSSWGSTLVSIAISPSLAAFTSCPIVSHSDTSGMLNATGRGKLATGTANISTGMIELFGQEHVFVSGHWPYSREADLAYGEALCPNWAAVPVGGLTVVGADLSQYRAAGLDLASFLCGFPVCGWVVVSSAPSPDCKQRWETALWSTLKGTQPPDSDATYCRTDHGEYVLAEFTVRPWWAVRLGKLSGLFT